MREPSELAAIRKVFGAQGYALEHAETFTARLPFSLRF
jgi:hypothetical protein